MASNSRRRPESRLVLTKRFGASSIFELAKKVVAGAIALIALGISPAQAEELQDWQYDAQTRSLTFTLPDSVTPLISVLAPDQLVLELPDTQVGDVMGQSVRDGLVESIVLEQATPETVWMVMEFTAGTVLADSQDATLLTQTASGAQQWQVRPALISASRRAANRSVASASVSGAPSASALRTPAPEIAQSPDFSELPILEPAVPIDESVVVPSLNATPSSVSVPPLEETAASASQRSIPPEPTIDNSSDDPSPVFDVEVVPAEPSAVAEIVPFEPPFLDGFGTNDFEVDGFERDSQSTPSQQLPDELPVASQAVPDEIVASSSEPTESLAVDSSPAASASVPVAEIIEIEPVQPANASRWPEPIPFGQPLPR